MRRRIRINSSSRALTGGGFRSALPVMASKGVSSFEG